MKQFDFLDLTRQGKELGGYYHGKYVLHLEGRILAEEDDALTIGVSLLEQDIVSHQYDTKRNSLDIYYQAPPGGTMRIAILPMTEFSVSKDIEEINVYDAKGKKSKKKK